MAVQCPIVCKKKTFSIIPYQWGTQEKKTITKIHYISGDTQEKKW